MSEMTAKERVRAALAGREVDRVPVSLWGHDFLREWSPKDLVAHTMESFRAHHWDFIKFNPRASYFAEGWGVAFDRPDSQRQPRMLTRAVEEAGGLDAITGRDGRDGVFAEHLYALRLLVDEVGGEVDILHTVFSPLSVLGMLCGPRAELIEFAAVNPDGAHAALRHVTETLTVYAVAALRAGAAGVFFAPLGWSSRDLCDDGFYREFGRPYDLQVLHAVRGAEFNVLHVCRERNRIDMLLDYPVVAVNWADRGAGNPSLAAIKGRSGLAVMGGIDHTRLHSVSAEEAAAQVRSTLQEAGRERLFVAGGCAISPEVTPGVRRAVVGAVHDA